MVLTLSPLFSLGSEAAGTTTWQDTFEEKLYLDFLEELRIELKDRSTKSEIVFVLYIFFVQQTF